MRINSDLLLDLGGLAETVAEVVELRTADLAAANGLDLHDARRMNGENLLAADAVAQAADGDGLLNAACTLSRAPSLIFT